MSVCVFRLAVLYEDVMFNELNVDSVTEYSNNYNMTVDIVATCRLTNAI